MPFGQTFHRPAVHVKRARFPGRRPPPQAPPTAYVTGTLPADRPLPLPPAARSRPPSTSSGPPTDSLRPPPTSPPPLIGPARCLSPPGPAHLTGLRAPPTTYAPPAAYVSGPRPLMIGPAHYLSRRGPAHLQDPPTAGPPPRHQAPAHRQAPPTERPGPPSPHQVPPTTCFVRAPPSARQRRQAPPTAYVIRPPLTARPAPPYTSSGPLSPPGPACRLRISPRPPHTSPGSLTAGATPTTYVTRLRPPRGGASRGCRALWAAGTRSPARSRP
ncbi:basic proline-rich protein-like [Tachyglossus aculeatus]|uniref:basic proline-rich protein-like n=1 Tax=Tachyglossus aculeatus TaxID=9261 RepID=UPI0018F30DDA|nr:basic proline-rich protein-like [Tachyglossus aculeatus]